jgi:tetratricopeptide (TPR) repeat protein
MKRLLFLGWLFLPGIAWAQRTDLDRAEELLASGEYARARAALDGWERGAGSRGGAADPSLQARALLLRAKLAPDFETAEPDYLAVVLSYPTAPQAAEALLRLGQGWLAAKEPERAIRHLERLVADYPASPLRPAALLWLARAHRAAGRPEAACEAAAKGVEAASHDPELAALLREEQSGCRSTGPEAGPGAARVFAVQSGAFRERRSAEALAARLRQLGFESRIVRVEGDNLLRVRVGRFADAAEASRLAARMRAAGLPALVVGDAGRERAER